MKENFNLPDLSVRRSGQTGARMKKYVVAKYIRLSMEDLDLCNSEEKAESVRARVDEGNKAFCTQ